MAGRGGGRGGGRGNGRGGRGQAGGRGGGGGGGARRVVAVVQAAPAKKLGTLDETLIKWEGKVRACARVHRAAVGASAHRTGAAPSTEHDAAASTPEGVPSVRGGDALELG